MIKAEKKIKWIEALRSGRFDQAKGRLKKGSAFCCLGVFAEISGCSWSEKDQPSVNGKIVAASPCVLLNEEFIGLSLIEQRRLSDMNDRGKSFAEIADYIENF